jgi:membrane protease YdiL (CAAX protease family)
MTETPRRARKGTILRLAAAHFALVLVVNLVFFARGGFHPLASATGGLISGSLVASLIFSGILVGVVILRMGGLRPRDVGLIPRNIPRAVLWIFGIWGAAQAVQLAAGLIEHGSVELRPEWANPAALLGILMAQMVGNALFEEIAYRGFLFPQIYLRLPDSRTRLLVALLFSQSMFALAHIPNRIYLGMTLAEIALDQVILLGCGVLYALVYLRTRNLFIVVGIHALGNAPTSLFASSTLFLNDGASILIYTLLIAALLYPPLLKLLNTRKQALRQAAPA